MPHHLIDVPIFVNNMDLKSFELLRSSWNELTERISTEFGIDPDVQGVLFLIGIQELGQGRREFSKDEKQDLMHIATCRLLSIYGYYELDGSDDQGWPHWKQLSKLPALTLKEQDMLLKQAILEYFKDYY